MVSMHLQGGRPSSRSGNLMSWTNMASIPCSRIVSAISTSWMLAACVFQCTIWISLCCSIPACAVLCCVLCALLSSLSLWSLEFSHSAFNPVSDLNYCKGVCKNIDAFSYRVGGYGSAMCYLRRKTFIYQQI